MEAPIEALVTAGRLDLLLARYERAERIADRRFVLDALERALLLSDPGAIAAELREEITALSISEALLEGLDAPVPPHAVLLPFVTESGLGFGRLVYVSPAPELKNDVVRAALEAAAEVAPPLAALDRYGLAFAQPSVAQRLDVSGRSLGAAVFASAVALFSGGRIEPGTLISGELAGDKIGTVGGLAQKLEGSAASRGDLARVIVPSRNAASVETLVEGLDVEVIGVATPDALLAAALRSGRRVRRDPEAAVADARRAFRSGWDGYRWPTQREPLERLLIELPSYRPDLRVEVLTMRGAVNRHLGAPDESARILAEARAIVDSPTGAEAVPDIERTLLAQHEALTFARLCRFDEATSAADVAIAVAQRGRLRGELLKAHGCAGLVALARGRAKSAVRHQRIALSLVVEHRPSGAPRTSGYLIDALGRAGRIDEARDVYRKAQALLDEGSPERRASREAWLRIAWAEALSLADELAEARKALDAEPVHAAMRSAPLPGLIARRLLGATLSRGRNPEEGWALLAASPVAHGRGLLPHVRFLAHLNVLVEARLRAERDALGPDAVARAETALTHLPRYGEVPHYLGAARRRAARALESSEASRAARALGTLVNRALRLT